MVVDKEESSAQSVNMLYTEARVTESTYGNDSDFVHTIHRPCNMIQQILYIYICYY